MSQTIEADRDTKWLTLPNGAALNVLTAGSEESGDLVVFLHAVGGDHSSWRPQLAAFARNHLCVSFDFRGHGKSKAPSGDFTIEEFAHDAVLLVAELGYCKAHFVGLSMGGVVALEIFRQSPSVVQSLTLANSWCYHPEAAARVSFMEGQLKSIPLSKSSEQLIPGLFAKGTDKRIIDEAIGVEASKDPSVFLSSWRSMFAADYRSLLNSIDVPLLLIGGSEDVVTPTEPLLTSIHEHVPGSWLVSIDGAGHFSNLDHPEEFNTALKIHLNRARLDSSQLLKPPGREIKAAPADTVAHALLYLLSQRGIRYFFSNSGTDFTPIIDALARYNGQQDFELKPILVPHENTAIAMAHGYYLLSGKPQAVMAHVNVGTANMGLGIINANRSRIPMLVLAGKTPWYESDYDGCRTNFVQWGQDTFDQGAYFREFTKWDYELKGLHNLETVVDRALAITESPPAGPVYLTLPKEVLCQQIAEFSFNRSPRQVASSAPEPSAQAVERAAQAIIEAQQPLIITAELGRYRRGVEMLTQLATQFAIPVIEHGKRNFFNFPTNHPMHLGFSPSPYVEAADLVIAVESHVPYIPALSGVKQPPTMLQIGIDPLCANIPMRSFPVDYSLTGDPARCLELLSGALGKVETRETFRQNRFDELAREHKRVLDAAAEDARRDAENLEITKRYLSYCIGQALDDNCVIFNEYNLDPSLVPRTLTDSWFENSIASGLGWSLGAALGAQLASPERTMVVTLGDGTYLFNTPLSAHYVASAYKLPIVIIVFNDSAWSTIKKSYLGTTPDGWAVRKNDFPLCNFDVQIAFEQVAESCGGIGMRVEKPAELPDSIRTALKRARTERKHVLLNVICQRDA